MQPNLGASDDDEPVDDMSALEEIDDEPLDDMSALEEIDDEPLPDIEIEFHWRPEPVPTQKVPTLMQELLSKVPTLMQELQNTAEQADAMPGIRG
jgi:hypothetical protein